MLRWRRRKKTVIREVNRKKKKMNAQLPRGAGRLSSGDGNASRLATRCRLHVPPPEPELQGAHGAEVDARHAKERARHAPQAQDPRLHAAARHMCGKGERHDLRPLAEEPPGVEAHQVLVRPRAEDRDPRVARNFARVDLEDLAGVESPRNCVNSFIGNMKSPMNDLLGDRGLGHVRATRIGRAAAQENDGISRESEEAPAEKVVVVGIRHGIPRNPIQHEDTGNLCHGGALPWLMPR